MKIRANKPLTSLANILMQSTNKFGLLAFFLSVSVSSISSIPIVMSQYLSFVISQSIHNDIDSMYEITTFCIILVLLSLLLRTLNRVALLKVINKSFSMLSELIVNNYIWPSKLKNSNGETFNKNSIFNDHVLILTNNVKKILPSLFDCSFSIFFSLVIMIYIDTLTFIGIIPIIIITLYLPQKVASNSPTYLDIESNNMSSLNDSLTDVFRNKEFIYSTGTKDLMSWLRKKLDKHLINQSKKWIRWNYAFNVRVTLVALICSTVLIISGNRIFSEELSIPEFLSFYVLLLNLIPSLDHIFRTFIFLQAAKVNLQVIEPFTENIRLQEKPLITSHDFDVLRISNLTLDFNGSKTINVGSFDFCVGKTYIIKGNVGVGKSTLLKMIIGLVEPSEGDVQLLNGSSGSRKVRFQDISYVSQDCLYIDDLSVTDNVILQKPHDDYKLGSVLKGAFIDHLDKSALGQLSIGEKQRVEMARALYKNSKIMILDEPTSALDEKLKNLLWPEILKEDKNKIKLVVTHDFPKDLELLGNVVVCTLSRDRGLLKCC